MFTTKHFLALGILVISCNTNKEVLETKDAMSEKMKLEEGFKKATVIYSTLEGDCPYTISVEGESVLFDPVNLESNFKKNQEKVWVKYHPLRMPNRCDKANPVEITEIVKRG